VDADADTDGDATPATYRDTRAIPYSLDDAYSAADRYFPPNSDADAPRHSFGSAIHV
jgi:hypothetical protein